MTKSGRRVVVLGAGLTGAGTALELARQGVDVVLIDQDETPVNRASLRNEGKIHLGFIYAKDTSLDTARMQLEGALQFRSLLSRWIGDKAGQLRLSTPFVYLVARDSLSTPAQLAQHYDAVDAAYRQALAEDEELDYLGLRPDHLYYPLDLAKLSSCVDPRHFSAAFHTEERAIDTEQLAQLLRAAIAESPRIHFLPQHKVKAVERHDGYFSIEGDGPEGAWKLEAKQVVNALWDGRFAIDQSVGLPNPPGWLHRMKYRVIARVPDALRHAPSITGVLGPYGDIVIRPDSTAYLSWYPIGMKGWSHDVAPPADWDAPCRGKLPQAEAARVAEEIIGSLAKWYPPIRDAEPMLVDAGAIVAYGKTDVDDSNSGLHDRTRIGVLSSAGYHSVDPGKLTTAPVFAMQAAERVLAGIGQP